MGLAASGTRRNCRVSNLAAGVQGRLATGRIGGRIDRHPHAATAIIYTHSFYDDDDGASRLLPTSALRCLLRLLLLDPSVREWNGNQWLTYVADHIHLRSNLASFWNFWMTRSSCWPVISWYLISVADQMIFVCRWRCIIYSQEEIVQYDGPHTKLFIEIPRVIIKKNLNFPYICKHEMVCLTIVGKYNTMNDPSLCSQWEKLE
jgi:hypothetical protein